MDLFSVLLPICVSYTGSLIVSGRSCRRCSILPVFRPPAAICPLSTCLPFLACHSHDSTALVAVLVQCPVVCWLRLRMICFRGCSVDVTDYCCFLYPPSDSSSYVIFSSKFLELIFSSFKVKVKTVKNAHFLSC